MTGYTVHTGSNVKFVLGWDNIFHPNSKKGKTTESPAKIQTKSVKRKSKPATKKVAKAKSPKGALAVKAVSKKRPAKKVKQSRKGKV